jgi:Cys-tRNA(Pro)/Cys-tRNA(Cys) deacylase
METHMTPAIRTLDRAKVPFTLHRYEHHADAEAYGVEAAEALGVEPGRVFKTIVCQVEETGLLMALVPVRARIDLKALARALGVRKADLADPTVAERTTGYVVGGISPLGGRKRLAMVIDASVLDHATVFVSAGKRGLEVELAPGDLLRLTDASTAVIAGH